MLPEARLGQRRRLCFTALVSGYTEDGAAFEEKATVRDVSVHGAYLCLSNRPRLQSELRVVIHGTDDPTGAGAISLRATVRHCEARRNKGQNGVGVFFIDDVEPEPPRD